MIRKYYNCRRCSKWSYPVSDKTLSCFSENNKPKSQVMQPKHGQRRELWSLAARRTKVSLPSPLRVIKGLGHNWNLILELLWNQRVHCPRRFSAGVPYHKWPRSRVLQLKLILPAFSHNFSHFLLKDPIWTLDWGDRFEQCLLWVDSALNISSLFSQKNGIIVLTSLRIRQQNFIW